MGLPRPVRRIQVGRCHPDSIKVHFFSRSSRPTYSLHSDAEIRANIFKSLLLNSLSLTSIYAFDLVLQPLVHSHPSWLHRNVGWFYRVLWLFPVVCTSFYLNVSTTFLCDARR